jgi:prepilin peptidase CpaA
MNDPMPLSLFDWTHLAALAAMLLAAMWHDTATRRIPNTLVLWGSLTAIGLSLSPHGIGLGSAIAGGLVGFLGFLVFYLIRAVGAGDVKLAAATGLFVGYPDMLWVNLLILLAGGVLSITWAVFSRQLGQTWGNLSTGFTQLWLRRSHGPSAELAPFPVSATRIPYALAIAAGTAVHVLHLPSFS